VGCGDATTTLEDGEACTVSCAEGDTGNIYRGILEIEVSSREYGEMPKCPVKINHEYRNPHLAFDFQALPNWGVGLARLEFVINNMIGCIPRRPGVSGSASDLKREVEHAARATGTRAASRRKDDRRRRHHRGGVLAETGDRAPVGFQSNEYKKLIGGAALRAGRGESDARIPRRLALLAESFRRCFEMECQAMRG